MKNTSREIVPNTPQKPEGNKINTSKLFLVLRWVACVICIIEVFAFFPSVSCIFWAMAAVLLLPIRKLRDWIKSKIPQKPVRVAAGVAAGIAALSLSPTGDLPEEMPQETLATETVYTMTAETEAEAGIVAEEQTKAEPETETETEPGIKDEHETETEPETQPEPGTEEKDSPGFLASLLAGITSLSDKEKPDKSPAETETETITETKVPETIPETKPETKAPETKEPETEPPKKTITITHKDSSLSPEMVEALEGVAAFWAPTGTKIHLNPFCRMFQGTVYAGTVEEANSVKAEGWCGVCSKNANENTKTNVNATPEVIADCYSYQDYLNQIPAQFFDD